MSRQEFKKVLLMGRSGSGKTSMRSIIFANYVARDTMRLAATIDVEHSHLRFLGNLVLNLWDCGGQEAFMESYFESQREHIFKGVQVLIYVFDVDSKNAPRDLQYYKSCADAIAQFSPSAKVFCLLHKMDLIAEDQRDAVFSQKEQDIKQSSTAAHVSCFKTSIWDETLYKAWSQIVYSLIPNVDQLERQLERFAKTCAADEVVLFERVTFLVIAQCSRKQHHDVHRFEKISNIIKQFKLSCGRSQSQPLSMHISNSTFSAFVGSFTSNTAIMVVSTDPDVRVASTEMNVKLARPVFEKFIKTHAGAGPASGEAGL